MTSPAVILLDLRLHDGDGIEFLRVCKKSTKMPVGIIITAYATRERSVTSMTEGAVAYLVKPFGSEKLKKDLRKYVTA